MPKIYAKKRINQTFPVARMHECNDGEIKKYAVKFFEYWSALSPDQVELASVRIYRAWPIVDMKLSEPGRTRGDWDTIVGAIPFEPKDYLSWFVEKYGSGEWKCYLNEQGIHDSIIECAFSALDPSGALPKVDLKTVVWGSYKNASYRQSLKNNGIRIPGEDPVEEAAEQLAQEEEDVNTTAVEALAKTNEQLMNRLDKQREPEARNEGPMDYAAKASVDLIGDAAKQMIASAGQGLNPSEMMDSSVKMIKSISELMPKPEKPDLSPMTEMMKMVMESQNKTLEKAESALQRQHELELARINAAAKSPETGVAKVEKSFIEQLREYKEIGELLGGGGKKRRNDDDDDEPKKPGWLELLLQNGPQIVGPLSPILLGIATRFGLMPSAPTPAPQQTAVQQQPGPPQPPNPLQQLMAQINQNLTDIGATTPDQLQWIPLTRPWVPTIIALQGVLLAKFTQQTGPDGYALAEYVCCEGLGGDQTVKGRSDYMAIKEQLGPKFDSEGPSRKLIGWPFMLLIRANPAIWEKVQSLPRQLETFVTEFFTYDEMLAKEQEDSEQKVQ